MSGKEARIRRLIDTISAYLQANATANPGADAVLRRLADTDLSTQAFADLPPQQSRHHAVVRTGIANTPGAGPLSQLAEALSAAADDLSWREDDMRYYPPGADLGEGYTGCNVHTLLIGPGACGFHHPDFTLGLFALGPRTLYRDHQHEAPETYINLTPRTGWRIAGGAWEDRAAGSIIFNPSKVVHATRVYEQPFLSVFSWLENIDGQCSVVPADDWPEIEAGLKGAGLKEAGP